MIDPRATIRISQAYHGILLSHKRHQRRLSSLDFLPAFRFISGVMPNCTVQLFSATTVDDIVYNARHF
jgi:hypothetical protein